MAIVITGMGTSSPPHSATQTEAFEAMHALCCDSDEQRDLMEQIYQRAGVEKRASVLLSLGEDRLIDRGEFFFNPRTDSDDRGPSTAARMEKYEDHALKLAVESSRIAIDRAEQDLSQIRHLVTVSCSGFYAPGFDIGLIESLGLSPETSRTHVGFMGCHGSFNGLRAAKALVEAEPDAAVLMCSVELCSLHHHYGWQIDKVVANGLFADGSGAVVCRSKPSAESITGPRFELIRNGSCLIPDTNRMMSWRIGDNGFEMTLSQRVPRIIEETLAPWMSQFLAKEGLTIQDVKGWAVHPGGPKILDSCVTALGLDADAVAPSREVLAKHGNMSSSTVLFVLERMLAEPMEGPVVALGFGPGLTTEAMLLHCHG